jgi:Na+-transporting methylmalonyl-CoA/oxaloacetate decarboxylase gamma subunit
MLAGQEIGLIEVLMITAFGMIVAMAAMVLLWWFVVMLSKAVAWKESKSLGAKSKLVEALPTKENVTGDGVVSKAEIAAIIAAVNTKTGLHPSQYKITSIQSGSDATQEEVAAVITAIYHSGRCPPTSIGGG